MESLGCTMWWGLGKRVATGGARTSASVSKVRNNSQNSELVIQLVDLITRPKYQIRAIASTALAHRHAVVLVRLVPDAVAFDGPSARVLVITRPENNVSTIPM